MNCHSRKGRQILVSFNCRRHSLNANDLHHVLSILCQLKPANNQYKQAYYAPERQESTWLRENDACGSLQVKRTNQIALLYAQMPVLAQIKTHTYYNGNHRL